MEKPFKKPKGFSKNTFPHLTHREEKSEVKNIKTDI
jgi:hypothetical protein